MSITTRVKNILLTPKTEWAAISHETETPQTLLGKYVIPMALIPAVALFIGFGLIGIGTGFGRFSDIGFGARLGVQSFVGSIIGYYLCTYVIDALAPTFGSEKNIGRSAQLVAYSFTASWVAGIFSILPSLRILSILGLYGVYLIYEGIPVMKKTPEDKRIGYLVLTAVVLIVITYVVALVLERIMYATMGGGYLGHDMQDLRWR
ncbi:MAG TPA: Yip1 family protein [Puia sp.]|nr:Yip1 family protein [Puia sp.]